MEINLDEYAVYFDGVAKSYGPRLALQSLSLGIRRGEFFGLLGPNGAGKTTTLNLLCGALAPDLGMVFLNSEAAWPRTHAQRHVLGWVPQDLAFYPALDARANLGFFGALFGLHGAKLREREDTVLKLTGLEGRDREPVAGFSGGMKRRLNIAIGLLHEPAVLVLDEPTVGVDAQSRSAIMDALEQINKAGTTIIYSTHYMEEAERLCQRVAILDQGRMIALDTPAQLRQSLGGRLIEVEFAARLSTKVLKKIAKLDAKRVGKGDPNCLRLSSANPEAVLKSLFELAASDNLSVKRLQLSEPDLEAVFLKLTGRQLRD